MEYKIGRVKVIGNWEETEIRQRIMTKLDEKQACLLQVLEENREWELLQAQTDVYYLFHLSSIRKNLLEWFPFKENCSVLELNAQTGIITQLLCERAGSVTAVVAEEADAYINAVRNKEKENLQIIVGAGYGEEVGAGFDYVILAGLDTHFYKACMAAPEEKETAATQYARILACAKQVLKQDGCLLVAQNNRLGLQYWSGKTDYCCAKLFQTIQGDVDEQEEYSFSKKQIGILLQENGLKHQQWYYPCPDYQYPLSVYSDEYLPGVGDIRPTSNHFGRERYQLFDEKKAFDALCEEGLFDQFANSFLVVCGS